MPLSPLKGGSRVVILLRGVMGTAVVVVVYHQLVMVGQMEAMEDRAVVNIVILGVAGLGRTYLAITCLSSLCPRDRAAGIGVNTEVGEEGFWWGVTGHLGNRVRARAMVGVAQPLMVGITPKALLGDYPGLSWSRWFRLQLRWVQGAGRIF